MEVKVYSLPGSVCQQCRLTKRKLDDLGIAYTEVPVADTPGAMEFVKSLGYSAAPVVVVDLGDGASWSWSGFRPSQFDRLVELVG